MARPIRLRIASLAALTALTGCSNNPTDPGGRPTSPTPDQDFDGTEVIRIDPAALR